VNGYDIQESFSTLSDTPGDQRMYARLRFDIRWNEIARAALLCLRSDRQVELPLAAKSMREATPTLSVRSAFDLLLSALKLPLGSEVIFSEITVPHMLRIAEEHGLVPVSLPVDPRTLHVDTGEVVARITDRTRMIVVAHLFGARTPLEPISQIARSRGVLLVEDAAQALVSGHPARDPVADVSLYSFGPIKTATAMGGGIALVEEPLVRERMSEIAAQWPRQSRWDYLARIAKIGFLKLLSNRRLLATLVTAVSAFGGDADQFVGGSARGFAERELFTHLRRRPCAALEAMIAWRLADFETAKIEERTARGGNLAARIAPASLVASSGNSAPTYWVFPVVCQDPEHVVTQLRTAGFDASQISGLTVVGDDSPDHWFRQVVFVPNHAGIPKRSLERAAEITREAATT